MVTDRKQRHRQRLGATSTPEFDYTKRHARICPNTFNSDKMKERLGSGCLFRIVVPLLLGLGGWQRTEDGGRGGILCTAGGEEEQTKIS